MRLSKLLHICFYAPRPPEQHSRLLALYMLQYLSPCYFQNQVTPTTSATHPRQDTLKKRPRFFNSGATEGNRLIQAVSLSCADPRSCSSRSLVFPLVLLVQPGHVRPSDVWRWCPWLRCTHSPPCTGHTERSFTHGPWMKWEVTELSGHKCRPEKVPTVSYFLWGSVGDC